MGILCLYIFTRCPCNANYGVMNNRDYKQSASDSYYHIYNRGNAKQDIFVEPEDYRFFLLRLVQNIFPEKFEDHRTPPLPQNSFSLISYCLMPNHFHFLLRQNKDTSPSKLLSRISTSYSKYFNKKYDRVGHLFQDQFKQILIENNEYLLWLSAYINQNPKTANMVKSAEDYPWSSYLSFLKPDKNNICDFTIIREQFKNTDEYIKFNNEVGFLVKERKNIPEDISDLLFD